jgi:hypothetical protein
MSLAQRILLSAALGWTLAPMLAWGNWGFSWNAARIGSGAWWSVCLALAACLGAGIRRVHRDRVTVVVQRSEHPGTRAWLPRVSRAGLSVLIFAICLLSFRYGELLVRLAELKVPFNLAGRRTWILEGVPYFSSFTGVAISGWFAVLGLSVGTSQRWGRRWQAQCRRYTPEVLVVLIALGMLWLVALGVLEQVVLLYETQAAAWDIAAIVAMVALTAAIVEPRRRVLSLAVGIGSLGVARLLGAALPSVDLFQRDLQIQREIWESQRNELLVLASLLCIAVSIENWRSDLPRCESGSSHRFIRWFPRAVVLSVGVAMCWDSECCWFVPWATTPGVSNTQACSESLNRYGLELSTGSDGAYLLARFNWLLESQRVVTSVQPQVNVVARDLLDLTVYRAFLLNAAKANFSMMLVGDAVKEINPLLHRPALYVVGRCPLEQVSLARLRDQAEWPPSVRTVGELLRWLGARP